MNKKGLAPILIVLLIAAAVGGYFVYTSLRRSPGPVAISPTSTPQPSPTPSDETANWKTYTSKYGYSFQYPTAWNVTTTNLEIDDEVKMEFKDPKSPPTEWQIQLKIPQELQKNMTFNEWIKNHFPASTDIPQQEKEVTVSGSIKAKEITTSYEGVYKLLLIPYQSKVYILKFNVLFGQMKIYEELVYNQILSTFRFLP